MVVLLEAQLETVLRDMEVELLRLAAMAIDMAAIQKALTAAVVLDMGVPPEAQLAVMALHLAVDLEPQSAVMALDMSAVQEAPLAILPWDMVAIQEPQSAAMALYLAIFLELQLAPGTQLVAAVQAMEPGAQWVAVTLTQDHPQPPLLLGVVLLWGVTLVW